MVPVITAEVTSLWIFFSIRHFHDACRTRCQSLFAQPAPAHVFAEVEAERGIRDAVYKIVFFFSVSSSFKICFAQARLEVQRELALLL